MKPESWLKGLRFRRDIQIVNVMMEHAERCVADIVWVFFARVTSLRRVGRVFVIRCDFF